MIFNSFRMIGLFVCYTMGLIVAIVNFYVVSDYLFINKMSDAKLLPFILLTNKKLMFARVCNDKKLVDGMFGHKLLIDGF